MADDALMMQRVCSSVAIVLTKFSPNILASVPEGLIPFWYVYNQYSTESNSMWWDCMQSEGHLPFHSTSAVKQILQGAETIEPPLNSLGAIKKRERLSLSTIKK